MDRDHHQGAVPTKWVQQLKEKSIEIIKLKYLFVQ